MVVLLALAAVDYLLPAVQVPLFAWLLVILIWVSGKAVNEAKRVPAPKKTEAFSAPVINWIQSTQFPDTYASTDNLWAIVADQKDHYTLWGEDEQVIGLGTLSGIGAAFNKAEIIINTVTPEEK